MSKTINLSSVVRVVHEEELSMCQGEVVVGNKSRLEELYEQDRTKLQKIFAAIDFCPDLIKNEKGEYTIPQEDGEFFEGLIKSFTKSDMKCIRDGRYHECDFMVLHDLLSGLDNVLIHLGVDEELRDAQLKIMQKKTDYHLLSRFAILNTVYNRMLGNLCYAFTVPGMNFTFDDKCNCLDDLITQLEEVEEWSHKELGRLMRNRQEYIKNNSIKLTFEEVQFSEQSKEISRLLNSNEEYIKLRSELKEIENGKGFLYDKEKQKLRINKKIVKIFHSITDAIPLDVEKMTKIEKIMCLCDGSMVIQHEGGTDDWYVVFDDPYNWKGIID